MIFRYLYFFLSFRYSLFFSFSLLSLSSFLTIVLQIWTFIRIAFFFFSLSKNPMTLLIRLITGFGNLRGERHRMKILGKIDQFVTKIMQKCVSTSDPFYQYIKRETRDTFTGTENHTCTCYRSKISVPFVCLICKQYIVSDQFTRFLHN